MTGGEPTKVPLGSLGVWQGGSDGVDDGGHDAEDIGRPREGYTEGTIWGGWGWLGCGRGIER